MQTLTDNTQWSLLYSRKTLCIRGQHSVFLVQNRVYNRQNTVKKNNVCTRKNNNRQPDCYAGGDLVFLLAYVRVIWLLPGVLCVRYWLMYLLYGALCTKADQGGNIYKCTHFAMLCFVVEYHILSSLLYMWLIYPYLSGFIFWPYAIAPDKLPLRLWPMATTQCDL